MQQGFMWASCVSCPQHSVGVDASPSEVFEKTIKRENT